MPFIQRTIQPVFLSRPTQQQQQQSSATTAAGESSFIANAKKQSQNDDFTFIANCTLANVLRQLGSVVLIADEILSDLGTELHTIRIRSDKIRKRIINVEKSLENIEETIIYKPNDTKNFVDDKDVSIYKTKRTITLSLFTPETRPQHIKKLYDKAAATPVVVISNGDTNSEVNFALCSRATFGHTRRHIKRKIDAEIETRMPASIEELRKWTSSEAIGEITVSLNCLAKVGTSSLHNNNSTIAEESYASFSTSYVDGIDVTSTSTNDMVDGANDIPLDHKLPSPEEQCFSIAQKYPAEIVSVNTSEVRFDRMCSIRKSLGHMPSSKARYLDEFQPVRRSTRGRKPSGKRRNTIAGIDDKDIKEAITQIRHSIGPSSSDDKKSQIMPRSKSNDLLRSNGTTESVRASNRFSNFRALKQWGKHRLKLMNKSAESRIEEDTEYDSSDKQINSLGETRTIRLKTKSQAEKMLKQNPLFGSSEKIFPNLNEADTKSCSSPSPTHPVKLRTTMTRRQKRTKQYRCEEPNSSSGNWSASSESGRTSASSEVAMHNKASNSCSSLNHRKSPVTNCTSALTKRKINTSTSSSITSDDTMAHELPSTGYVELYDDETSSMYSCDTEGYFTSFHVDSGLKTLKEEELPAVPALLSTSALLPINDSVSSSIGDSHSRTTIDSDYELFGRGSTSTTASSAGTVCTTLLGSLSNNSLVEIPAAPERKSSLNAKSTTTSNYGKPKLILNKNFGVAIKASEREALQSRLTNAANKAQPKNKNCNATVSDMEVSENSDFEGIERVKRIRGKTQINAKRIPSICVITPLNSDDEDRVAAMEEMLSSLNINQKDLPLSEFEQQTIVQVHRQQSETETALADIVPLAQQICSQFSEKSEQCDDEYVTIKDVKPKTNVYPFNNNVIDHNLERILSGNLNLKTEYVSLNELPCNTNYDASSFANGKNTKLIAGTNVNLKPNGMFVYDSSTLRYKRSLCTTFKGPSIAQDVKPTEHTSANLADRSPKQEDKEEEVVVDDKRSSSTSSSPFEKMASDSDLTTSLDDIYVTLSTDKRDMNMNMKKNEIKSFGSVSDPELSDSSKETLSLTWPLKEQTPKVTKRRFSWENITKSTKESKLSKLRRRRNKFNWLGQSKEKKTPPKTKITFKTSTPLKNQNDKEPSSKPSKESGFGNSTTISNVSHKSIEPPQTTCSDRLGTPKTSLNDFKKLLLNATNKRLSNIKPSAVEQLKLKQESMNASPMKILDLSSSPKSFTKRRIFQQVHPSSPHKKSNLMSPRSRFKHSHFNKTPISSIPEANAEDEQTASEIKPAENQSIPIYATPRKNSIRVLATNSNVSSDIASNTNDTPIAPIIAKTESSPETGIIETNFTMDDNIFLLSEENNFMKGEVKPFVAKLTSKSSTTGITKPSVQQSETAESQALETSF